MAKSFVVAAPGVDPVPVSQRMARYVEQRSSQDLLTKVENVGLRVRRPA